MPTPPTGNITFLFTDIEGSTKLWEQHPDAMQGALHRHDTLLRTAIEANNGYVFKTVGDAFCAAFSAATDALSATLSAHRALQAEQWGRSEAGDIGPLSVRAAMHTGTAQERDGDYFGPTLNRVARLLAAGHGQQTLLSLSTYELIKDQLPGDMALRDLGERRLKDLTRPEQVYQVLTRDLPSEFPPLKTLDYRPNNLPAQPTPLVGRETELDELHRLVRRDRVRLVTLTGPGGIGKTRLALHAAANLLDDFQEGVWFVELASTFEARLVTSTIAQTLGVKEAAGQTLLDSLNAYLKEKEILLVLDNFEQVADAAPQVGQLLAACPRLTVLVTSRIPLRIRGEKEFPVSPLQLPDLSQLPSLEALTQVEAVRLFIDRATSIKPDFQVTKKTAPAVAQICVRLDGLPLAIELAAARVRLFPLDALLSRLSKRLQMLTEGARDLPARQQTLRATVEWSYDLLNAEEKHLFERMAVFQGGRTFQALEAICAPEVTPYNYGPSALGALDVGVLEGVESLVTQNVLQQRVGSDDEPRFWMLETIQEFAREKLEVRGEASPLEEKHALYFASLAEQAEPQLTGTEQALWLGRLEDEHDNMRAALRWARTPERSDDVSAASPENQGKQEHEATAQAKAAEIGLRIAGALWRFWYVHGYLSEGREQIARVLSLPTVAARLAALTQPATQNRAASFPPTLPGTGPSEPQDRFLAKALNGAGRLAREQGDFAAARSLLEVSLALFTSLQDKAGIATVLSNLGLVTWNQGDHAAARSLHEEALSIRRELGDKWGVAASLINLGILTHELGDYAAARRLYEEALAIQRELGDGWSIAVSLNNLADAALESGDYDAARSLHEEALAIRRELGDKWGTGSSLANLGGLVRDMGEYATARAYFEESLALRRELGDKMSIAWCLEELATVERLQGAGVRGARLRAAAEALRESIGSPLPPNALPSHQREVVELRALLGEEAFARAWAEGDAMSMEQAIDYALEELQGD